MGRPGEKITRLSIIFLQVQPQLHKYVLPNIHSGRSPAKLKYDIGRKSIMMQNKMKELEQKLELERTNKLRLENQVERLKETAKKTEREHEIERFKHQTESEKHRKLLNQFRDLKEDYLSLQGKESDTADKNSHLNKKIEIVDSENIILKKDLELALKRIEDFHTAISSEIDSDSDTITFSDEEFLETLSQSRQSSIRDSIAQEISDVSGKKL